MLMLKEKQTGFTIVELLIVIVVIGILAAITIVAYNGIQERARVATVSSDLASAAKQFAVFEVDAGRYPTTLSEANNGQGIKASTGTTYQYTNGSASTYCLTATNGTTSYKISNTATQPSAGGCPGHGVGGVAAITNLATNPSFETNTVNAGTANGTTLTQQASSAIIGGFGISASAPANGINDSGISLPVGNVVSGITYTYSASVRSLVATSYRLSVQGSFGAGNSPVTAFGAGEVKRLSVTVTATGTGKAVVYVLRSNGSLVTNFDVDGVMQTEGSTLYNYADGTTANWAWAGATNNSTSTGPPL
jgi:prepilin-type N-terminal cleavage/methylation domain-containing protein